jgi:hypothetical protein
MLFGTSLRAGWSFSHRSNTAAFVPFLSRDRSSRKIRTLQDAAVVRRPISRPEPAGQGCGLISGKAAPEVKGTDQDGKHFKLSDYKGKVVLCHLASVA